jgi:4-amino-4-deoxy-L-arabinose transferase-like glycosyltransferase
LRLGACAILSGLLYLPGLGRPALWEPDEGRYAEIAREMLVSRDFVTPHDDWVRYFEKPPLVYWCTAASLAVLGRNEMAARLPAALSAIGQVVITMALAEVMFGAAAGVWAALALALSPLFFGFGRFLTLDPTLSLFIAGTLAASWMWLRASDTPANGRWLYLAAGLAGLGTLTKGPVALVLSAAISGLYLLLTGRLRLLRTVPWLRCGLIYLLITMPWFILVAHRNPGFLRFFFVHEHLERYTASTEHEWGPYFLLVVAVAGTWPWIAFVPRALKDLFRFPKTFDPAVSDSRRALLFCALWFAVILVFFSIPRSKLGSYILPALPPVAILAGYAIDVLARGDTGSARRIFRVIALIDVALSVVVFAAAPHVTRLREFPALRFDLEIGVGGLAIGGLVAFLVSRSGRIRAAVGTMALGVLIAIAAAVTARGDAAGLESYRGLARAVAAHLRSGCVLASYHHHVQALPFYTGQREVLVGFRGELAPWSDRADAAASFIADDQALRKLWSSHNCVVLIANRKDLTHLYAILTPSPQQVGNEGKKYVLINR